MTAAAPPRPTRRRRRRPGQGWVPRQHGAWAMLLLPLVVGAGHAGWRPWHALLAGAWLVGYLAFAAAGLWLRARRSARYRSPVLVYGGVAAALTLATVALEPDVVAWAPVYAPLLAVSLWCSWRRADRSLLNDTVTVVAACLVAAVAHATTPWSVPLVGWQDAAVLLAYLLGTVLYVKTMIRARGDAAMLLASRAYHVVAAGAVVWLVAASPDEGLDAGLAPALGLLFGLLAVRAAVVPARWPGATPKAVGLGEIAASAALAVLLLAA